MWRRPRECLGYLEDSEDLKVGVTESNEQVETSEEAGASNRQIARQATNENGQKKKKTGGKEKKRKVLPVWPDATHSWKVWLSFFFKESKYDAESERQEALKAMVEDKIRLRGRATEKYYEHIFEGAG